MTEDKIIERVQKLLGLAGNNPSEAEREAAMQKALAILAEHNLTMEQVEKKTSAKEKQIGHMTAEGRSGPWIKSTYKAIGGLYFCEYLFASHGKKTVHYFIGERHNCLVAHQVAAWVSESLWKEGLAGKRRTGSNNTYLTSFLNAASDVLLIRVTEIIAKAKSGDAVVNGKNLPVLASLYDTARQANQEYSDANFNAKETRSRKSIEDLLGARHGDSYARDLNLDRQVGDNKQERLT